MKKVSSIISMENPYYRHLESLRLLGCTFRSDMQKYINVYSSDGIFIDFFKVPKYQFTVLFNEFCID